MKIDEKKLRAHSSLAQRGYDAITFADMAEFAEAVETRHLTKLLEDLPALAELSEAKFTLAVKVLRRRFQDESEVDKQQLRSFAAEIALEVEEVPTRQKIRHVFN